MTSAFDETGRSDPVFGDELVLDHPERASALIVIDSARNTQPLSRTERVEVAVTRPSLELWPYGNLKHLSAKQSADTKGARAYAQEAFDRMSKSDFVEVTTATAKCFEPDARYRVPVPLLLLCGEHDELGSIAAHFDAWKTDQPEATALRVPNASHLSNMDNPEFVNRGILEFLEAHAL